MNAQCINHMFIYHWALLIWSVCEFIGASVKLSERLWIFWSVCEFLGASESQSGSLQFWPERLRLLGASVKYLYQKNDSWKKCSLQSARTGSGWVVQYYSADFQCNFLTLVRQAWGGRQGGPSTELETGLCLETGFSFLQVFSLTSVIHLGGFRIPFLGCFLLCYFAHFASGKH